MKTFSTGIASAALAAALGMTGCKAPETKSAPPEKKTTETQSVSTEDLAQRMMVRMAKTLTESGQMLGTRARQDVRGVLEVGVERLGENPTAEDIAALEAATDEWAKHMLDLADANDWKRITRAEISMAISETSPIWPLAERKLPVAVPPPVAE